MSFNSDELQAPEWVNSDFLKKVLEYNGDLENVTIDDYQISAATALGDHFASIMFRVKITFSTQEHPSETRSIIIKTSPFVEGFKKDILDKTNIDHFATEIFMYSKVLAECGQILKKAGYNDLLAPKMIYQSTQPHEVIVFEDLRELGYFMFPKTIPNEVDTDLIFSKLGQYHASVFKLASEDHKDFHRKGGIFNAGAMENLNFLREGFVFFKELVSTLPGFEIASEKLEKLEFDKIVEKCKQSVNSSGSYELLNHGDYHIKNMMFKGQNETEVSEVVLVDFQVSHWGSPAFDLVYMSAVIPPRMRMRAYQHYFDTFIDVLKKSDYNGVLPTFELLQKDLKSYRHLDLFFLATLTPLLCADKDEINEQVEVLLQSSNHLQKFYKAANYISYVKELLPVLLQEGIIDGLIDSD